MRRLYAELAFLAGVTWLESQMVRLAPGQVRERLAVLEARRAGRLAGGA